MTTKKTATTALALQMKIEQHLAQTQCQLCQYQDCRAYAKAIVNDNESIDRCLPGGEKTLVALADIMQQRHEPYVDKVRRNTKSMTAALIREDECIGCTKCLQACPVDAIIGSAKQMHTVISSACNGCELCIPPCPVDCIDTIAHPQYASAADIAEQSQKRYQQHQLRQQQQRTNKSLQKDSLVKRQAAIQAAIQRHKQSRKEPSQQ